ncbi:hypothetical protein JCM30237_27390 [Halolamina litorea]|nr:hypothetical protein [Halolamina litorea]
MWQNGEGGNEPEWRTVETEFNINLFGTVQTVEGPYAVGEGGHLVADRGDGWEVIFDDGPSTRQNQLRAMDVTDDGKRVWMVGSSGAMACYDVEERKKFDYSYPNEMTSTWEAIAVCGDRGNEKVLAANGSGEVLPFIISGYDVNWEPMSKPAGKGSNVAALAATPDGVGFAVDTSGNAFKTTPEGWEDIGVVNAQVKFYDVYAGENEEVYIAAGDGRVYRYDDSYNDWTPIGVTDETSMRSIDVYEQDGERQMVVLGNNGSVFQRDDGDRWEEIPSPTSAALFDLSLGSPDIAVGKAGTVIERPRGTTRDAGSSPDGDEFDGRGENDDGDQYGSDEDGSTSENGTTDGTAGDDPTEDDTADDTTEDEQTADDEESRSDEEIIAEIVDLLQELSDGDDDDLSLSDLFS